MYAVMTRRKMNLARAQETRERASSEIWPKMQQASGFVSFTLIQGEDGVNTSVILWESKAQADAFREGAKDWFATIEGFGHRVEQEGDGEVIQHLTASK